MRKQYVGSVGWRSAIKTEVKKALSDSVKRNIAGKITLKKVTKLLESRNAGIRNIALKFLVARNSTKREAIINLLEKAKNFPKENQKALINAISVWCKDVELIKPLFYWLTVKATREATEQAIQELCKTDLVKGSKMLFLYGLQNKDPEISSSARTILQGLHIKIQ
ncbi:hypothetical protein KKG83_05740 [Candidatus Micrarchaeota archaeon]|nr:hypothetical protein [Candidatus Micrarchaeota archaeon]MBU2476946.1 hypothetical protein [Candidatus Micrarchaeota archaeon]